MGLFVEAGVFAWVSATFFIGGLVLCLRHKGDTLRPALAVAVAIAALGQIGAGLGQRLVSEAVKNIASLDERVMVLNLGTQEAAANQLVCGAMALLLVAIGFGTSVAREQ